MIIFIADGDKKVTTSAFNKTRETLSGEERERERAERKGENLAAMSGGHRRV